VIEDQTPLEIELARVVDASVDAGWEALRFEAWAIGSVMSYELFTLREGVEEQSIPPMTVYTPLDELKSAAAVPNRGTWLSLIMKLSSDGELTVDYNFDDKPQFDIDISTDDYELELRRFPRNEESVPLWWRERIEQGDQ
jgi:hypothetical protein